MNIFHKNSKFSIFNLSEHGLQIQNLWIETNPSMYCMLRKVHFLNFHILWGLIVDFDYFYFVAWIIFLKKILAFLVYVPFPSVRCKDFTKKSQKTNQHTYYLNQFKYSLFCVNWFMLTIIQQWKQLFLIFLHPFILDFALKHHVFSL